MARRRTYRRKRKIYRGKPSLLIAVRNSLLLLLAGAVLGAVSKWSDLHNPFLAEMTSGIALWILLASLIAMYSRDALRGGLNSLLILGGMLAAYYAAAEILGVGWSKNDLIGWSVIALVSPVLGYLLWCVRERFPLLVNVGIILVQVGATCFLFRRIGVFDLLAMLPPAGILLWQAAGSRRR